MDKKSSHSKKIPVSIRHHLIKQEKSSQTMTAYCQKNGIPIQTFYSWRKRLKNRNNTTVKTESSPQQITFASLGTLHTQQTHQALFEISFSYGTMVRVFRGTTAEELEPFLDLLSGSKLQC